MAAISVVAYSGFQNRAKDSVITSKISQIQKSIELYYIEKGTYPKSASWGAMGVADSTGVWPLQNMTGLTADTLKLPFDTSGDPTSLREGTTWASANGKIGYISLIADNVQTPTRNTCYMDGDICTSWRMWYQTSNGTVKTVGGGQNPPNPSW